MTDDNKILDDVSEEMNGDPEKMMGKIDKELKKVKYEVFGKVKVKFVSKADKELKDLHLEKQSLFSDEEQSENSDRISAIDSKIADALATKQRESFCKELGTLLDTKKNRGDTAALFQLKEKIIGTKNVETEAVAIVDPVKGVEVSSAAEIRQVSLNYCVKLLTNREPGLDFEPDIEMKRSVHRLRMQQIERFDDYDTLPYDHFVATYDRLSHKAPAKYPFIMNAGSSMKPALFNLCKRVWSTESLPSRWYKSTLVQIYKGSGLRSRLENQRFIHMKDEFPKFFGNLVMDAAKDTLIHNMSKFHIGTKPGHRAQEHLFVTKSVISLYMKYDKAVILSAWDLSKFFDKECLTYVMGEIFKSNVRGKLYRLLYHMNKNTRICVSWEGVSGLTCHHIFQFFVYVYHL